MCQNVERYDGELSKISTDHTVIRATLLLLFHSSQPWLRQVSEFNGTPTPKGSYRAKTGDNDCNINSSRYSLSTALCESIRNQAKSEQNVRQDLIPRVRHGETALYTPDWDKQG